MPFGFATRMVAAWRSSPAEAMSAALAGLTWRGVAIATGILCACAVMSYGAIAEIFTGDAQSFGSWFGGVLGL